ncbi:MAG: hypothetical protein WBL55_10730 [Xanthobacteraceae bacterium]
MGVLKHNRGHNRHRHFIPARQLKADAVEKGKNESAKIFACAPVETGFSLSNASQRAYEGCWLKIGLAICPLRHFRAIAPVLLKKSVQPPKKPFSTASAINGHALRSIDANVYSITASAHDPGRRRA